MTKDAYENFKTSIEIINKHITECFVKERNYSHTVQIVHITKEKVAEKG